MRPFSCSKARALRVLMGASALSILSFRVCLGADTDQGPVNFDLESGTLGQVPAGWFVPRRSLEAGYGARLSDDHPYQGRRCALLS